MWCPAMSARQLTVSVSHHAFIDTLQSLGLLKAFIEYMGTVHSSSKTVLEITRERFQSIKVARGVREIPSPPS